MHKEKLDPLTQWRGLQGIGYEFKGRSNEMKKERRCLIQTLVEGARAVVIHQIAQKKPRRGAKGLAQQIHRNFPNCDCSREEGEKALGSITIRETAKKSGNWVVALTAQKYIGGPKEGDSESDRRYWLKTAITKTARWAEENRHGIDRIWAPEMIGAGLARGSGPKNREIIDNARKEWDPSIRWSWVEAAPQSRR